MDEALTGVRPIESLPGQNHYGPDSVCEAVEDCLAHGVTHCILFGLPKEKDACGSSAWAERGVIQEAIRAITRTAAGRSGIRPRLSAAGRKGKCHTPCQ